MAVTTKKQFAATTNATTTVFSPVSIQLNNQDDLDVYVTLSGGTRVLQLRQSTGSTAQSSHPQVSNTDGLYFPAVSAGATLYNYTLSSDNNTITFNSALPSGAVVFCERRTRDADSSYTSFASGSTIRATDLNNSSTESNFTGQDARNKALDLEGSIFGGVQPSINGVAQPFVNSAKIIDGSIATADIADSAITSAKLADGTIVTGDIADGLVTTAKIAADAVNGTKIADDSINSEHYVDGSIDTAHIADSQVTTAKINDNAVTTAKITADAVTGAKIADDQINSEHYVDGSIDTAHIADAQITTAKIVDANVTTAKIAADAVNGTKIADDSINSEHYVDGSIDTAHIADNQITTAKIVDANVTAAKIASNAVTTDKIQDGELTTLAGMQSGTASKLAAGTTLTADIADLNQIDGLTKQTTISDSDASFPTSGAVVDYVAAQLEPFGGFEAIANEVSFPNTQPVSGVAVSIADAAGIVVNGSGVSTTGRTVGGSTVTINGINSQFNSTTVATGIRFIVTSTGSGQVYNYHKATLAESDLVSLSGDINDFAERYRVGSSNPTSSLDNGDLFFNTSTGKLLVYNGTNSAWEEAQSIGNFFISTLSPAFDGTTQDFTLTNAPTNAQQVILSINGVVQKPNAGSSAPSEGFALSGSTVKLSAAPATGSTYHAVVMGSTVNIGTPSNNTVTTAILQNGSVTTAKIVDANVTTAKITDANVTTAKIADDAVTADKIANSVNSAIAANTAKTTNATHTGDVTGGTSLTIASGAVTTAKIADDAVTAAKLANTSVTAASYGSSTSIPSITVDAQGRITAASGNTVNTDLVGDSSPQLGGDLDTNSHHILLDDAHAVKFGDSNELTIEHAANGHSYIVESGSGDLNIHATHIKLKDISGNSKLETDASGINVTGDIDVTNKVALIDNGKLICGVGDDLQIYHDGSHNRIHASNGYLQSRASAHYLNDEANSINFIRCENSLVSLHYNGTKKFETTSTGSKTTGYHQQTAPIGFCAYRYDTGTGNEYPIQDSNGNHIGAGYFGKADVQAGAGTLTTHTEYNNNGSGGSCFSHDGCKFTAPVAGVYNLSFHLSLYVVSDTGNDNSQTWGWYKNGVPYPHNWSSHYSGLNMVQSSSYIIGQDQTSTITDATELGSPSHSAIFTLAQGDTMRIGWSNHGKKMGIRSFTYTGFLLG